MGHNPKPLTAHQLCSTLAPLLLLRGEEHDSAGDFGGPPSKALPHHNGRYRFRLKGLRRFVIVIKVEGERRIASIGSQTYVCCQFHDAI